MPYVTAGDKDDAQVAMIELWRFDDPTHLRELSSGQLNYLLNVLVDEWSQKDRNYDRLLRAHGTFGAAGAEFYRRVVVPYEERKLRENGEAFPSLETF